MLSLIARSQATSVLVGLLAISFCGCRATTSKLASVPGMSWLARDDGQTFGEGWAGYEPPPDLPRPSSSSEPTNAEAAAGIASTDASRASGTNATNRFDATRYGAKGFAKSALDATKPFDALSPNNGSAYGNYASAYGKYGPGAAADSEPSTRDLGTPQSGPYGDGKSYASSSISTANETKSSSDANPYSMVSSSASSSRFGGGDNADAASAYTASRDSRFGGSGTRSTSSWADDTKSSANASNYTPPGFPTKTSPTTETSRFASDASRFAASAANDAANALNAGAEKQSGSLTNDFASQTKQQVGGMADQAKSRFTEAANNTIDSYSAAAQEKLDGIQGGATKQVDMISEYGKQMSQRFGGPATELAQQAQAKVNEFANPGDNMATSNSADSLMNSAQDRFGAVTSPVADAAKGYVEAAQQRLGQAQEVVNRYASGAADVTNQAADAGSNRFSASSAPPAAANNFVGAAQDTLGQAREAVRDYASSASDYASGVKSASATGADLPRYPTTSTPNAYQLSPGADVAPPTMSPPENVRPLATPPSSPIRRSPKPWRPGGTSDLQGSNGRTSYKQVLEEETGDVSGQLVLAVGDKYQFPRMFR